MRCTDWCRISPSGACSKRNWRDYARQLVNIVKPPENAKAGHFRQQEDASWSARKVRAIFNFVLPRVLVKKPATRLKIPLIAFGQGHLLVARKAVRVGDHFGSCRRRTRLIFFVVDASGRRGMFPRRRLNRFRPTTATDRLRVLQIGGTASLSGSRLASTRPWRFTLAFLTCRRPCGPYPAHSHVGSKYLSASPSYGRRVTSQWLINGA